MVKILLSGFNSCHGGLYVDSVFPSFFNQSTYLGSFDTKLYYFQKMLKFSNFFFKSKKNKILKEFGEV